jgi:hypothetical protein
MLSRIQMARSADGPRFVRFDLSAHHARRPEVDDVAQNSAPGFAGAFSMPGGEALCSDGGHLFFLLLRTCERIGFSVEEHECEPTWMAATSTAMTKNVYF